MTEDWLRLTKDKLVIQSLLHTIVSHSTTSESRTGTMRPVIRSVV
jgi:hypothetical protein